MWSVKNESNTTPFKNVTRSSEDSTSFFIIINVNFLQEISYAVFLSHLEQLRLKWVVLARQSKLSGGLLQRKSYPSMGTKRLSVYPARSCLLKRSAQHNVFNQPRKLSCWTKKEAHLARVCLMRNYLFRGQPSLKQFSHRSYFVDRLQHFFPGRTAKVNVAEDLFRSTS